MSDSRTAIYDDTMEYLNLCQLYGETPEKDEYGANPYSKHARDLMKRHEEAKKTKQPKGEETA